MKKALITGITGQNGAYLAAACCFLMENYSDSAFVNKGTGKDVSIKELAELTQKIVGYPEELTWNTKKPDGTPRKLLDVSRLTNLGWEYSIGLEEGIREVYTETFKS